MAQQSSMDVSKWQAARRQFLYMPVLWFFYRLIESAVLDAGETVVMGGRKVPSDAALLARDWVASSEPRPGCEDRDAILSFPECCQMLNTDPDAERVSILLMLDAMADFDTDECWARLEVLRSKPLPGDDEPLFDAPRVVPALDQMTLNIEAA